VLIAPVVGPDVNARWEAIALAKVCVFEAAVGAALGFAMSLVLAGARQAGELVGAQAGFSAASLYDPEIETEMTPLGHLYGLIALGTFLALDGPMRLVGSLIESYRAVPQGSFSLNVEDMRFAFGRITWALSLALGAAAPAAAALVAASLMLGVVNRWTPSLQLGSLALPTRSIVGLVLVLVGLAALGSTFASAWISLF
jgi:flagellar biosynthesis protein FliR